MFGCDIGFLTALEKSSNPMGRDTKRRHHSIKCGPGPLSHGIPARWLPRLRRSAIMLEASRWLLHAILMTLGGLLLCLFSATIVDMTHLAMVGGVFSCALLLSGVVAVTTVAVSAVRDVAAWLGAPIPL